MPAPLCGLLLTGSTTTAMTGILVKVDADQLPESIAAEI